jgi:hypothetical protein
VSGTFYKTGLVVVSLALAFSVVAGLRSGQESRQQVDRVTAANQFLRKTLGEMTIALTQKEKEIDRIQRSPCSALEKSRDGANSLAAPKKI